MGDKLVPMLHRQGNGTSHAQVNYPELDKSSAQHCYTGSLGANGVPVSRVLTDKQSRVSDLFMALLQHHKEEIRSVLLLTKCLSDVHFLSCFKIGSYFIKVGSKQGSVCEKIIDHIGVQTLGDFLLQCI